MSSETVVGYLGGVGTTVSFVPQVVQVVRNKKVESPVTFFIHSTGVLLWVVYGVLVQSTVIVVFNAATLLMNLLILGVFLRAQFFPVVYSNQDASPRSPTDLAEARRSLQEDAPGSQPQRISERC